jgi:hypothetical protein
MEKTEPAFYFCLPRLLARWRGGNAARTEMNWLEANIVGGAVHLIVYLFFARLFIGDLEFWQQLLLLAPLVVLVWVWWLLFLYVNSLILKFLRSVGLMRQLADNRAQSILICVTTTVFAIALVASDSWLRAIGVAWIAAVFLNQAAALLLGVSDRDESNAA